MGARLVDDPREEPVSPGLSLTLRWNGTPILVSSRRQRIRGTQGGVRAKPCRLRALRRVVCRFFFGTGKRKHRRKLKRILLGLGHRLTGYQNDDIAERPGCRAGGAGTDAGVANPRNRRQSRLARKTCILDSCPYLDAMKNSGSWRFLGPLGAASPGQRPSSSYLEGKKFFGEKISRALKEFEEVDALVPNDPQVGSWIGACLNE